MTDSVQPAQTYEMTCDLCHEIHPNPVYYPNSWYCRSCGHWGGKAVELQVDISKTPVPQIKDLRTF